MSLDTFLQSVERRAFKIAVLATRNETEALDIVQEAMLKLVKSYAKNAADEWPLLFQRILQNCIRDWHRASARKNRLFWLKTDTEVNTHDQPISNTHWESTVEDSSGETPPAILENAQDIDRVHAAIEALPFRQQQSFLLRSWEGYSVQETAVIMACTKSSVKTHHARALKALRLALEGGEAYVEQTG